MKIPTNKELGIKPTKKQKAIADAIVAAAVKASNGSK
jgi:hypothetical protein